MLNRQDSTLVILLIFGILILSGIFVLAGSDSAAGGDHYDYYRYYDREQRERMNPYYAQTPYPLFPQYYMPNPEEELYQEYYDEMMRNMYSDQATQPHGYDYNYYPEEPPAYETDNTYRPNQPQPLTDPARRELSQPDSYTDIPYHRERLFLLVNQERRKIGIEELFLDLSLVRLAQAHANDMVERNYFDHGSPEGASPFDRLDRAQISYDTAAEVIAADTTAKGAVRQWMRSSAHRTNLMDPAFTRTGIGLRKHSNGNYYFVQILTD